jgi:hypothetical protein
MYSTFTDGKEAGAFLPIFVCFSTKAQAFVEK